MLSRLALLTALVLTWGSSPAPQATPTTANTQLPTAVAIGNLCFTKHGVYLQAFQYSTVAGDGSLLPVIEGGYDPYRCRDASIRNGNIRVNLPTKLATTIARRYIGVSRGLVSTNRLVLLGSFDQARSRFSAVGRLSDEDTLIFFGRGGGPEALANGPVRDTPGPNLGKRLTDEFSWAFYELPKSSPIDRPAFDRLVSATPHAVASSGADFVNLQAPVVSQSVIDSFLTSGTHLNVYTQVRIR